MKLSNVNVVFNSLDPTSQSNMSMMSNGGRTETVVEEGSINGGFKSDEANGKGEIEKPGDSKVHEVRSGI
jgi:hypothetical protein